MAGILKVDQVQSDSNLAFNIAGSNVAFMNATSLQMVGSNVSLAGTNVITSGKVLATAMPTGSVLQVVQYTINQKTTINSAAIKVMETSITTKAASSKILALVSCSIGGVDTYTDFDLALALGYKTGTVGAASTDYTAIHGDPYNRQTISGLGTWYTCDTQRAAGSGGIYWAEEKSYFKLIQPGQAVSTVIYVALWAGSDGTYYLGSPSGSTVSDAGAEMSITLMEIAP